MIDLCSIEVADEFDLQHRVVFRFLTKQKSTRTFCVHNSAQKSGSQLPKFRRLDFCTQNLADFYTDKNRVPISIKKNMVGTYREHLTLHDLEVVYGGIKVTFTTQATTNVAHSAPFSVVSSSMPG